MKPFLDSHAAGGTKAPIYVSVGHRLSLDTALAIVKRCCLHRVPEPIRQADIMTRDYVRTHLSELVSGAASRGIGSV